MLLGLQAASADRGELGALLPVRLHVHGDRQLRRRHRASGGHGDADHDLAAYRGLARRQPVLALAFAVLLLAQAGVPFTTGFLAKFQVVVAAVDGHSVPLAVVAMVSAAVAAFFYLRVTVLMYAPEPDGRARPGRGRSRRGALAASGEAPDPASFAGATVMRTGSTRRSCSRAGPRRSRWPGAAATDGRGAVVPAPAVIAIGICLAVTVVFGIVPGPLVDFAHKATLLFLP